MIRAGKSVDKWKIYRDVCDARAFLVLRDRAMSVLNALLSFYPETYLVDGKKLVVFPSNAQLSTRANGIARTTLRENLAILVNAGMIHRKDSPNGKRYARKDRAASGPIRGTGSFGSAGRCRTATERRSKRWKIS